MSADCWTTHADAKRPKEEDEGQGGTPKRANVALAQARVTLSALLKSREALRQREELWRVVSEKHRALATKVGTMRAKLADEVRAAARQKLALVQRHERLKTKEQRAERDADRSNDEYMRMAAYNAAHETVLYLTEMLLSGNAKQEFFMQAGQMHEHANQEGGSQLTMRQVLPMRVVASSVELTAETPRAPPTDRFDDEDDDEENDDGEGLAAELQMRLSGSDPDFPLPRGLFMPVLSATFEVVLGQNLDGSFTEQQLDAYQGNRDGDEQRTDRWPVVPRRRGVDPIPFDSRLEADPNVLFLQGANNIKTGDLIRFNTAYVNKESLFGGTPDENTDSDILSHTIVFKVAPCCVGDRSEFDTVFLTETL